MKRRTPGSCLFCIHFNVVLKPLIVYTTGLSVAGEQDMGGQVKKNTQTMVYENVYYLVLFPRHSLISGICECTIVCLSCLISGI